MSFNGVLRVLYVMVTKGDVVLMYFNGGGVLLELVYTAIFISIASAADRRRANLLRSIVPGLLILILGGICYLTSATAYRLLCAICGSALYIVPMIDVVKVIKLRKRKYMPPLLLTSTSFLNSIIWAVISGIQSDWYIMVPNLVGLACACIQLGLHIGAPWLFKVHFSGLTELFLDEGEEESPC
ncbi:bidirectional sugar transporter SWEET5 [Triticum aestivum]|uniref:bidirectional sugar transporter SWEET5 n=1 Tax=Triticum aestivum TaxID=4565 RepID=UPI001D026397|nr:bidirectional sugar transporter SWEET5-like [Triticum aestivum]